MLDSFALLYAGGCLAIEAGVLPWKEPAPRAALHDCLIAAIMHQRAGRFGPQAIRRILRQQLRPPNVVRREPNRPFGPDRHDGFYEVVGAGSIRFTPRRFVAGLAVRRAAQPRSPGCTNSGCW
jgi:hypothetical protein